MEEVLRDLELEIQEFENICHELGDRKIRIEKPEVKLKPILVKKEKPTILPKPKLGLKTSVSASSEETFEGTEV